MKRIIRLIQTDHPFTRNGWSVFLSLTQTAEIAIFTFPGILCLAECFFLAEYLLQESVQPFAELVFEESEVVDRYLGLSWRSHFDDRGVAFGSCPVDVEQGRGYLQRLLAAEDGGVQKTSGKYSWDGCRRE